MKRRVAPLLVAHRACPWPCPWCPVEGQGVGPAWPTPEDVHRIVRQRPRARLLSFLGGDWTVMPRDLRDSLLHAAALHVRRGSIDEIRLPVTPAAVPRLGLRRLRALGVTGFELMVGSLDRRVLGSLQGPAGRTDPADPARALSAVATLRHAGFEVIAQLVPGLPEDSSQAALAGLDQLLDLGVDALRLLPALSLEGSRLTTHPHWAPLGLEEAVQVVALMTERADQAGVPVIRAGLQPTTDLAGSPEVVAGPWHPAFGELVTGWRLERTARALIRARFRFGGGFVFRVHPADESALRGPGNHRLRTLQTRFRLDFIEIQRDAGLPRGTLSGAPAASPRERREDDTAERR